MFPPDSAYMELALLSRSHVCSDLSAPASNRVHLGTSLLARGHSWPSFSLLVTRSTRSDSALSIFDSVQFGVPAVLKGAACPDASPFVLDFASAEASSLLQSLHQLSFPSSVNFMSRSGSSILALDGCHLSLLLLVQASACLDAMLLILVFGHAGTALLLRRFVRAGALTPVPGRGPSDTPPAALDPMPLDAFLFPRGLARSEHALFAPSFASTGSALMLRSPARVGLLVPASGAGCFGSSPFALDFLQSGTPSMLRGLAWFELHVPALALSHLGFAPLPKQLAKPGSSASAFVFGKVEPATLVLDSAHPELLLASKRVSRSGALPFVFGFQQLGSPLVPRSLVLAGPSVSLLSCMRADAAPPALDFGIVGAPSSLQRTTQLEAVLLAHDHVSCGSSLLARSAACLDLLLPALGLTHLDSPSTIRGLSHADLPVLASGLSRTGLVSFLLVLDISTSGSSSPTRLLAQMGMPMSALDLAQTSAPTSPQGCLRFEALPPTFGLSCPGPASPLLVVDVAHFGSSLLVRSYARPGSMLLALGLSHPELPLPPRHCSRSGSLPVVFHMARLDLPLPALDVTSMETPLPLRQLAEHSVHPVKGSCESW